MYPVYGSSLDARCGRGLGLMTLVNRRFPGMKFLVIYAAISDIGAPCSGRCPVPRRSQGWNVPLLPSRIFLHFSHLQ